MKLFRTYTKTVHFNFDSCYHFKAVDDSVDKAEVSPLSCEKHEEANVNVVYHVINTTDAAEVVIRCSDTDILVPPPFFLRTRVTSSFYRLKLIEIGTGNNLKYIGLTSLYSEIGELL